MAETRRRSARASTATAIGREDSAAAVERPLKARTHRTESAQSPHSNALVVATVRYIVQMKPVLTCDDARKTRSANV